MTSYRSEQEKGCCSIDLECRSVCLEGWKSLLLQTCYVLCAQHKLTLLALAVCSPAVVQMFRMLATQPASSLYQTQLIHRSVTFHWCTGVQFRSMGGTEELCLENVLQETDSQYQPYLKKKKKAFPFKGSNLPLAVQSHNSLHGLGCEPMHKCMIVVWIDAFFPWMLLPWNDVLDFYVRLLRTEDICFCVKSFG